MSSTSSTRRQPAIAFCASLSTSVAICTGCTNSVHQEQERGQLPDRQSPPSTPRQHPDHDHAGQSPGRPRSRRPSSAIDAGPQRPLTGPAAAPRSPSSSRRGGAPGDAVRPDHLGARRRSRRSRRAARRSAAAPRRTRRRAGAGTAGPRSTSGSERGVAPPASAARSRRPSRRVVTTHLTDADQQDHAAPLQELGDLVDVAGDPGDQRRRAARTAGAASTGRGCAGRSGSARRPARSR